MLSDREKDDIALTLCLDQAGLDLGGQREVTEVLRRHLLGEW